MDLRAGAALVDHIIGCCGGYWDERSREGWIEAMLGCENTMAAEEAARLLANRWTGTAAPSFGDFKVIYDSAVRTMLADTALPRASEKGISLMAYLVLISGRAEAGDRSARHEVETWRKTLRGQLANGLPGVAEARQWFEQNPDPLPYDA